jgi:glutamate-1-semialdehyde 2,1-aminomutase
MIGTFRGPGPKSGETFDIARSVLAQGVDSPVRAGAPMGAPPPVIASASGSRVFDVDGREYIDYLCAYGPVLLGHGDAGIASAVREAALRGSVTGTTHPEEVRLAQRLYHYIPSMQRLRFVSTGTEACMSAVRVARAYTRREKIVRFSGNYHGHSDDLLFSAGASSNGPPNIASGITRASAANVIILPYNDTAAVERTLAASGDEVAAILVEPACANMGLVLPRDGFLKDLRRVATRCGALLIFDEVITAFRLGLGGYQSRCGVVPDLTCIGKALGGGLPIAAFGGREDVMAVLAPQGAVFQGGTFSGNPLCVAAAHALLDRLESDPEIYDRLDRLGDRLAVGIERALAATGLAYSVVRLGSIVDFMFRSGGAHANHEEANEADLAAYARYYWSMLAEGVYLAPSPMEVMFVTAAHTVEDIDATVAAATTSLTR